MGEISLIEGAFYWVWDGNEWIAALHACGYFYPPSTEVSVLAKAIVGPLVPPPNPEQSE